MDKKKNIVIGVLLGAIVIMSVGYAALAQVLTITGTANIKASWNVAITGIEAQEDGMVGATITEDTEPSFTATSATFEVDLEYPGASATFDVEIENKGSIDAKLASITDLATINGADPKEVVFEVTGVKENDVLAAGNTATATVKVTWVSSEQDTIPAVKQKTATITFNYVQNP